MNPQALRIASTDTSLPKATAQAIAYVILKYMDLRSWILVLSVLFVGACSWDAAPAPYPVRYEPWSKGTVRVLAAHEAAEALRPMLVTDSYVWATEKNTNRLLRICRNGGAVDTLVGVVSAVKMVTKVALDSANQLWVVDYDGHVSIYSNASKPGLLWDSTFASDEYLDLNIAVDRAGVVWLTQNSTALLLRFDGSAWMQENVRDSDSVGISKMGCTRRGTPWILYNDGVFYMYQSDEWIKRWLLYGQGTPASDNVASVIDAVEEEDDGALWAASSGAIFHLKNISADTLVMQEDSTLGTQAVLFADARGQPMVVSLDSIFHRANGAWQSSAITQKLNNSLGTIVVDGRGVLWIGLNQQLFSLSATGWEPCARKDAVLPDIPTAFVEDSAQVVWAATFLGMYRKTDSGWVRDDPLPAWSQGASRSLRLDSHGVLWMLTGAQIWKRQEQLWTLWNDDSRHRYSWDRFAVAPDGAVWANDGRWLRSTGTKWEYVERIKYTVYTVLTTSVTVNQEVNQVALEPTLQFDASGRIWELDGGGALRKWNDSSWVDYAASVPIRNLLSLQRSPLGGLWLLAQEQAGFARLEQDVWILHQPNWNDSTEQITFGDGVMGFAAQDSGFWWTGNLFDYRHITAAGYVKSTHSLVHWDGSAWTLWDLPSTIGGVPSSLLPLLDASGSCYVLLATQAKWYELQCAQ